MLLGPGPGGALLVRPARTADWAGCWPLLQAMGLVDGEAAARQRFARVLANSVEFLPVAEQNGMLVGYAWAHQGSLHLRAGRSTLRLNDLFVTPMWRRHGVGHRLLEAVITWATEQQADWLEW